MESWQWNNVIPNFRPFRRENAGHVVRLPAGASSRHGTEKKSRGSRSAPTGDVAGTLGRRWGGQGEVRNLLNRGPSGLYPEWLECLGRSRGLRARHARRKGRKEGEGEIAMTGADLLVRLLKAQDVPFVTTLCGNGLDPLYLACKNRGCGWSMSATSGRRLHGRRGRPVAAAWASVLPRAGSRSNALTGLVNAYFDGAPMLLITGASETRTAGMGNFQDLDHVPWLARSASSPAASIARSESPCPCKRRSRWPGADDRGRCISQSPRTC